MVYYQSATRARRFILEEADETSMSIGELAVEVYLLRWGAISSIAPLLPS